MVDSILCKESNKCLFYSTLRDTIQSTPKNKFMNDRRLYFKIRNIIVFILLMNSILIFNFMNSKITFYIIGIILLIFLYLYINIFPLRIKKLNKRVCIMVSGYELIADSSLAAIIEILLYVFLMNSNSIAIDSKSLMINGFLAVCVLIIPVFNGFLRMMFTSRDLGILNRLLIVLLWWAPVINFVILNGCCKKVRYEYFYEQSKELRNEVRKESEVCRTKYPIVMVHGIFFRDWMFVNYWGRISKELTKNGAEIYYGRQQSSNSVCKSAEELKENILKIINDTGCEKVNIIAHSKGGLDARYAISCLGLSNYAASLTTINTPHRGCRYVDFLLNKIPDGFKNYIARKYNKTFIKLGDKNPDFLSGVTDLTEEKCSEFNKNVPDIDGVLYQSVTSKMKNMFSAGFPLNMGYVFAKIFDGENDGLVGVSSAKWGNFLGTLTAGKKGISHGDVVDLTRRDIKGYDVCEFYVELVKKLKERGY